MTEFIGTTPSGNANVKMEVRKDDNQILLRITETYLSGKSGSHVIVLSKATSKELIHNLVDRL